MLSGSFTAAGQASRPINVYGAFNLSMYGVIVGSLATVAGSVNATFDPKASLAPGQGLYGANVPPGTLVTSLTTSGVGTMATVQLGGLSTSQVGTITSGTDATALLTGTGIYPTAATVELQRTFDGGYTWVTAGIGGGGQPASYAFGAAGITNEVSFVASEPELGVGYRLVCTAFSGTTRLDYRLSISGLAAMAWGIPTG
ncbi:MAG: hypothetical protein WCP82_04580 [Alphaproteobacteria bacterium]